MSQAFRLGCLAILVLVSAAFGGRSGAETTEEAATGPGVSFIAYSPKPFYKDMDTMTVRFTTTGDITKRGLLPGTYTIWVETGKDKRDTDCTGNSVSTHTPLAGRARHTFGSSG